MSTPEPPLEPGDAKRARGPLGFLRRHVVDMSPLRSSRDFRLLSIGQAVSEIGSEIVLVLVPYQVYTITHSTLAVGLIGLVELVPVFFAPIIGGAIADAVDRRRFALGSTVVLLLFSVVMAWNATLEHPHLWALYVFAALSAGVFALQSPALRTWPARLFSPEELPAAIALEWAYSNVASLAGPAVAGGLIALIHPTGAYLVDAATFVVALGCLLLMRPSPPTHEKPEVTWRAIKEGFAFVRGRPIIKSIFAVDFNAMVFGFPMALFPAIADHLGYGPFFLGLLYAAPAAGSLVATLASGRAKHVRRQGLAVLVSVVVWGGAIVVLGFAHSGWMALLMLAIAGGGDTVSGVFRNSIMQTITPDHMRGRVEGVGLTVWATGPALGNLEAGAVATLTSVPFSIVSGGLITVLGTGVIAWLVPSFRSYRSPIVGARGSEEDSPGP